jgi:hypothetical protein
MRGIGNSTQSDLETPYAHKLDEADLGRSSTEKSGMTHHYQRAKKQTAWQRRIAQSTSDPAACPYTGHFKGIGVTLAGTWTIL